MKVQTVKRRAQLHMWAARITERNESGKSVKYWCAEQGIGLKSYYYWVKQLREELLEATESIDAIEKNETIYPVTKTEKTVLPGKTTPRIQHTS